MLRLARWIPASKGNIKIDVVFGFNSTKPKLMPEVWTAAEQEGNNKNDCDDDSQRPTRSSLRWRLVLSGKEVYQITGAPFTIRFRDLFLREPANAQESNLVYTTEDQEEYTKHVWLR